MNEPTIRVRIAHVCNAKGEWRCAESTIEYSGDGLEWKEIVEAMRRAHTEGALEASVRNRIEFGLREVAA